MGGVILKISLVLSQSVQVHMNDATFKASINVVDSITFDNETTDKIILDDVTYDNVIINGQDFNYDTSNTVKGIKQGETTYLPDETGIVSLPSVDNLLLYTERGKQTNGAPTNKLLDDSLKPLEKAINGQSVNITRGCRYIENGYTNSDRFACTNIIDADTYDLIIPGGWQCTIFNYVSDTEGTQVFAWRTKGLSKWIFDSQFVVSFRKSDNSAITDADYIDLVDGFNLVKYGKQGLNNDLARLEQRVKSIEEDLNPTSNGVEFCDKIDASVLTEMYFPNIPDTWKIGGVSMQDDYMRLTIITDKGRLISGVGNPSDGSRMGYGCSDQVIEFVDGTDVLGYYILHLTDVGYSVNTSVGFDLNSDKVRDLENSPRIKKYLESGENIVLLGDSMFGYNIQNNLAQELAVKTSKSIYNAGFPGCRAAWRTEDGTSNWDCMSLVNVADAIVSGDYSAIETAINSLNSSYSYFKKRLASLKSCDFTKPTTVFICYGNNDITGSSVIGDLWNKNDISFDKTTFLGAINYSLNVLLTKYPHMKIIYLTPMWRRLGNSVDLDGGTSGEKVAPYEYTNSIGKTFLEYYYALIENCERSGVKLCDMYRMGGRSAFNFDYYSVDSSHFNRYGYAMLAKLLAKVDEEF